MNYNAAQERGIRRSFRKSKGSIRGRLERAREAARRAEALEAILTGLPTLDDSRQAAVLIRRQVSEWIEVLEREQQELLCPTKTS